jgi:hypothetical protein
MTRSFLAALSLSLLATTAAADNGHHGFDATLKNCTELVGLGPVPFVAARALVPASYSLVPFNGSAGLVVRVGRCEAALDKGASQVTTIAQVGIAVIPPDGTGDINNYTLLYSTDNAQLAKELNQAGQPAEFDPHLAFELNSSSGEIYAAVSPGAQPAWFLAGSAAAPVPPAVPTVANWWFNGSRGVVKVTTSIPSISYGQAAFSLHTSMSSLIATLIGGNTYSSFVFFNGRGVFTDAQLTITVQ